jgi:signal transduction histidine kinase
MDAAAPEDPGARLEDLEARLRALQDENDRLAEAQTDAVLLGVLAEQVRCETAPAAILSAGLERMSVLKDLPLCMACLREGDRLAARAVHLASGDAPPDAVAVVPPAEVLAALETGPVPLSGAQACAAAGVGEGALPDGIVPRAALLLPFASRALGTGAFVLVDDRSEARLVEAAAVLERAAEIILARLENVALLEELRAARAALDHQAVERREPEEEPPPARRMECVERLAGGIAHDLNNLLTAVLGTSEMLLADLPDGDRVRDDLVAVREAGRRAAALTRQLLAFSRKQRLELRPVQLEEVLRASAPMLGRLVGERVTVRLEVAAPLPPVLADRPQLEQILTNLAVNARDAMPEGGTLMLALAPAPARIEPGAAPSPASFVRLEVSDTGEGMPPEVAARIFEPFLAMKPGGRSTGLGLATVYGIVLQHGGAISVRSALGRGATFSILLPATTSAPLRAPQEPARAGQGRGETVLVVDDEPLVRRAIGRTLHARGYAVVEAGSGEEALALAAHARIDLLLTDVTMPAMRGPELARAFQACCPGRPALLMSGYPEHGNGPENGWLEKPVAPEALARAIREALDAAVGRVG